MKQSFGLSYYMTLCQWRRPVQNKLPTHHYQRSSSGLAASFPFPTFAPMTNQPDMTFYAE